MYGSDIFQIANGRWEHEGYRSIYIPNLAAGLIVPKGTLIQENLTGVAGSEVSGVLASGSCIGFTTQDINTTGLTDATGFMNFTIGKLDNPIQVGTPCTLRKPTLGAELISEGGGVAAPGNLVCTSGTGAILVGSAYLAPLSAYQGSLRLAQTGDQIIGQLLDPTLTPARATSTLRIRWKYVGGAATQ